MRGVSSDKDGQTRVLSITGHRSYTGTALTEVRENDGSGEKQLHGGTAVQTHSDGQIAWGRWTSGKHQGSDDENETIRALHYFTFAGTPTLPVVRSFSSFGATASTTISPAGQVIATGSQNAASGTLQVNFPGASGGTASYNLKVPVSGQTFSLVGSAAQSGSFGFAGPATITSTGLGCAATCTGALSNGNAVRGWVGSADSSRAGVVYGFGSSLGMVTGAIVFKP